MTDLSLFASVPRGLESLLAGELRGLGAEHVKQVRAGVSFTGSLETAYRACLWSRLAGRVLLPLATGAGGDGDELYATAQTVDWSEHLGPDDTLAVDFAGTNQRIRDTRYGAVRVKDAVVDQLREKTGRRPSVDPRAPDVRINVHLAGGRVTISLDLSGQSLHRRGYRADKLQVEAPLKENLAAGLLLYAAWPKQAAAGGSLLDPLCGSGTLPIEAALMAADIAPGLLRAEAPPAAADAADGRAARSASATARRTRRWPRRRPGRARVRLPALARPRRARVAGSGRRGPHAAHGRPGEAQGRRTGHDHPRQRPRRERGQARARLRRSRRTGRPGRVRADGSGAGRARRGARPGRHQRCPMASGSTPARPRLSTGGSARSSARPSRTGTPSCWPATTTR